MGQNKDPGTGNGESEAEFRSTNLSAVWLCDNVPVVSKLRVGGRCGDKGLALPRTNTENSAAVQLYPHLQGDARAVSCEVWRPSSA